MDDYVALRIQSSELRNRTDTLPQSVCLSLGLPRDSAYAIAATTILAHDVAHDEHLIERVLDFRPQAHRAYRGFPRVTAYITAKYATTNGPVPGFLGEVMRLVSQSEMDSYSSCPAFRPQT